MRDNNSLYKYLKEYRNKIVTIYLIIVASNSVVITVGYLPKIIVDKIIPHTNWTLFIIILVLTLFLLYLLQYLLKIKIILLLKLVNKIVFKIRKQYFAKMQTMKFSVIAKKKYAEIYTNLVHDTEELSRSLIAFIDSISEVLFFILTFILLFITNYIITFCLLLLCCLIYGIVFVLGKLIVKRRKQVAEANDCINQKFDEYFSGIKDIIFLHAKKFFFDQIDEVNNDFVKKKMAFNIFPVLIQSTVDFSVVLSYSIIFILTGYLYRNSYATPGQIIVYLVFVPQLWSKFLSAINIYTNYLNIKVYSKRIFENMTDEDNKNPSKSVKEKTNTNYLQLVQKRAEQSICIRNMTFAYEKENYIFHHFNLDITKPGIYCIEGASGIGKSTLFQLLLKFYYVDEGEVWINNIKLDLYSQEEIRKAIAIVHQEKFLVNDTIMNNIIFGDKTITPKRVIELSVDLGFHSYIRSIPGEYEAVVSNTRNNISDGLKRLITIMRALVRDPEILLLDEITANVDSFTRLLIHKFLNKIGESKICLFITHNKSDYRQNYSIIKL